MKVTIEANDGVKFRLTSDNYQFILSEVTTVKDENSKNYGEEAERNQRFFPRLEQVAASILLQQVKSCDAETLQELLDEFTRKTDILAENLKFMKREGK